METIKGPAAPSVLVIDRSRWLRGEGGITSRLLRERDGKMCCLGCYGAALSIAPERLAGWARPDDVLSQAWPAWLVGPDHFLTRAGYALMKANDDPELSPDAREQKIAAIFAEHGVEVRFVDGAEQPPAGPSVIPASPTSTDNEGDGNA